MKRITRLTPMTPAMTPARSESLPSVADTVCTACGSSLTGRAP